MSESFGTFDNKFLILENPLPSITMGELFRRAKVPLRRHKHAAHQVFALDLKYGGGEIAQSKTLMPGEKIRVDEKFGLQVIEDFKPAGGSMCATNPGLAWYRSESEREAAVRQALMTAQAHYHTVGAEQVDGVQTMRGHSDAQREQFRGSIYGTYVVAMEKEKLITEALEMLDLDKATAPEQKAPIKKAG